MFFLKIKIVIYLFYKLTIEFIKTLRSDFSAENETKALTELCAESRIKLWSKNKELIFDAGDGEVYKYKVEELNSTNSNNE